LLLGLALQLSWPWYVGVFVASILFVMQQVWVTERQREACFKAFLNNNWVGLVIFLGLLAAYATAA
jgi:4-hydroxybenzoate polyprenyltransferase